MSAVTTDILSMNHMFEEIARKYPGLQVLDIPDRNFCYARYIASELNAAASLLANHLKDTGVLPGRVKGDATSKLTIGLLGVSNVEYVITEMCLCRMGYCVLFISPNNSPPAIAHLLTVTNASHIIVQDTLLASATEAVAHLTDPSSVSIIPQPSPDVFGPDARFANPDKIYWEPPLTPEVEMGLPFCFIHSSGSTGYPKAIPWINRAAVGICKTNLGLTAFSTLPLYHAFGQASMLRAWYCAKPLYMFPTASIPLTSANIIELLLHAPDVQVFYGVPSTLESLAGTLEGLQVLKCLKSVAYTGSACPDELGDSLVSNGVRLVGYYGLTEMGQLMSSMRNFDTDKGWNWVRASGPYVPSWVHKYLRFEPHEDDTYELFVLDGWPTKTISNQPDGTYATRDLFIKHPTIQDAYKYVGRVDDTLVMVNGEKTNPIPIELTLRSSPHIADAIVFGRGRTQIGALILPTEAAQHFPREEFLRRVASAVALANVDAPSHSQLATEALVLLPYGTVIPRVDKGSIVRAKVYEQFEGVIEELYARLEGEVGPEGKRHVEGEAEARVVVREVIQRTIERSMDGLKDDTDLFAFGLDSLQSTRIRNAVQREVDLDGKRLSINAVFEHPSITKLAKLVVLLSSGKDVSQTSSQKVMLQLVERYSNFKHPSKSHTDRRSGHANSAPGKVVVLTGTTGSLGSYILDELLGDPDVDIIYCLCRAGNDEAAADRLAVSMKTRKLLARFSKANSGLKKRVVALAADLSAGWLGLGEERYHEIANRVTAIIHNAWSVNFNLNISSFETHIRGAMNLIHLALSSPHPENTTFFFASSVSAVLSWSGPGLVPEAVMDDSAISHGMGYAQSKWVTEKLCQIAAQKTSLHTVILRIGQMVGDTTNGIWNATEGVSLMIKCADTIGILPELDERVSWLPVDYAAKSIVELVNLPPAPESDCTVYHVLHPTLVPFSSVIAALQAARLDFKRVSRLDWLKALRASDADERRNPSRKLLAFYESRYGGTGGSTGPGFCVDKTVKVSRWLREAPAVGEELVSKWVSAWRESGFLEEL